MHNFQTKQKKSVKLEQIRKCCSDCTLGLMASSPSRFYSCLHKWGMVSASCECGGEEQIVDSVNHRCPIHRPPHIVHDLMVLDDETIEWLLNNCS